MNVKKGMTIQHANSPDKKKLFFLKDGPHFITVILRPKEEMEQYHCLGSMGTMDGVTAVIDINEDVPDTRSMETLFHELIEYVRSDCDIRISHTGLSAMSRLLYGILRENKFDFSKGIKQFAAREWNKE